MTLLAEEDSLCLSVNHTGEVFQYDYSGRLLRVHDLSILRRTEGEYVLINSAFSGTDGVYLDVSSGEGFPNDSGGLAMVQPRRELVSLAGGEIQTILTNLDISYVIRAIILNDKLVVVDRFRNPR